MYHKSVLLDECIENLNIKENGGAYVVHEGDQARHDVGDVGTVKDIYDQLIMDGYSDEEARAMLRADGYNI